MLAENADFELNGLGTENAQHSLVDFSNAGFVQIIEWPLASNGMYCLVVII